MKWGELVGTRGWMWGWRYLHVEYSAADAYNPWDVNIRVGPLCVWTGMAPHIGGEVDLQPSMGRLRLDLPYLHIGLQLWGSIWGQWGWRKGKGQ